MRSTSLQKSGDWLGMLSDFEDTLDLDQPPRQAVSDSARASVKEPPLSQKEAAAAAAAATPEDMELGNASGRTHGSRRASDSSLHDVIPGHARAGGGGGASSNGGMSGGGRWSLGLGSSLGLLPRSCLRWWPGFGSEQDQSSFVEEIRQVRPTSSLLSTSIREHPWARDLL